MRLEDLELSPAVLPFVPDFDVVERELLEVIGFPEVLLADGFEDEVDFWAVLLCVADLVSWDFPDC